MAPAAELTSSPFVARTVPRSVRRRRALVKVADNSVLIALAIMFIAPFAFITLTALMSDSQVLSPTIWPQPFEWHNFSKVFTSAPLGTYYLNTIVYATLGILVTSVPMAYALARLRWRGRHLVL